MEHEKEHHHAEAAKSIDEGLELTLPAQNVSLAE